MKEISAYTIVRAETAADLTIMVENHIADGWQPFGSLALSTGDDYSSYAQAMVQYEE